MEIKGLDKLMDQQSFRLLKEKVKEGNIAKLVLQRREIRVICKELYLGTIPAQYGLDDLEGYAYARIDQVLPRTVTIDYWITCMTKEEAIAYKKIREEERERRRRARIEEEIGREVQRKIRLDEEERSRMRSVTQTFYFRRLAEDYERKRRSAHTPVVQGIFNFLLGVDGKQQRERQYRQDVQRQLDRDLTRNPNDETLLLLSRLNREGTLLRMLETKHIPERTVVRAEEIEREAREKVERLAQENEERRAKERARQKAEAKRKAREEAKQKVREETERSAREEAEGKAKKEADLKLREEAERRTKEETERREKREAKTRVGEEIELRGLLNSANAEPVFFKPKSEWTGWGRSYDFELNYLTATRKTIQNQIDLTEHKLSFKSRREWGLGGGDIYADNLIAASIAKQIPKLRSVYDKPYFARIDYELQRGKAVTYYIGQAGVSDEASSEVRVVSWTSPLSSLFYQKKLGPAVSSEGLVTVRLIRQFELDEGLQYLDQEWNETYFEYDDPILSKRLASHSNEKMRDIVETIQAEQDSLIRLPRNKSIIVQGSAGSGKTTVALHRLAYLFYEESKLDPTRFIVFGPNRIFLNYVHKVLPGLGVDGIEQKTFQEWAVELLNFGSFVFTEPFETMQIIEKSEPLVANRYLLKSKIKGSLPFKKALLRYLEDYEQACFPQDEVRIAIDQDEDYIVSVEQMRRWFCVDYKHLPIVKRREFILNVIERYVRNLAERSQTSSKTKIRKQLNGLRSRWKEPEALEIYFDFMSSELNYSYVADLIDLEGYRFLCRHHRFMRENNELEHEDLAPLLYIKQYISGEIGARRIQNKEVKYVSYQYAVIDEGQDYSPFQIELIQSVVSPGSVMILGDLGQSIFSFRGIHRWDEITSALGDCTYLELRTSYRSTVEITSFASRLIESWSEGKFALSQPILRHGREPDVYEEERAAWLSRVRGALQGAIDRNYGNIALIVKTPKEALELKKGLGREDATVLLDSADEYAGGIVILPAYLSKGIEFDAVVVTDASAGIYGDNVSDRKLLYVACTRALHELHVISNGMLSAAFAV